MTQERKTAQQENSSRRPPRDLTNKARAMGRDCLALAARTLSRRLTQIYDAHLEPFDLSLPQFSLMSLVAGAPDDTLAGLSAIAGLDPSTLTRNLQGLEKLGLVEIATVESDQRKRAVWLTEAGARKLQAAAPAWDAAQAEAAEALGSGMTAALKRAARAV